MDAEAGEQRVTLNVNGMSCASCVGRITNALEDKAGLSQVSVNLMTKKASMRYDTAMHSAPQLAAFVTSLGFPSEVAAGAASTRVLVFSVDRSQISGG
eukprot:SAG22_NODE_18152_length_292_cov_0.808290_1_plen_97_part_11